MKNSTKPFEPDFTLIDERDGINLFIDVEIDEPYKGLNDLSKRKPTHYQYHNTNRNEAFRNRGWITIRFADIQIHRYPDSCCRFISDVIRCINLTFTVPEALKNTMPIQNIKQWTREQAENWSSERYREEYLGIQTFGVTANGLSLEVNETELGAKIEEEVGEEPWFIPAIGPIENILDPKLTLIEWAINSNRYLSFTYQGLTTISKPLRTTDSEVTVFCYVKNSESIFNIRDLSNLNVKDNYYTLRIAGPVIGLNGIVNAVNTAINYRKHIRMKYTRSSWTSMSIDPATREVILNQKDAEESVRTINNIHLSINVLDQKHLTAYNLDGNYITTYCNKREEQRTFRFDRIGEIEILDL